MTKLFSRLAAAAVLATALSPFAAFASGAEAMPSAQVDLTDKASLQRGAALYMNYCAGCHSLSYQRYSRMGEDLGLSKEQVEQNLAYASQASVGMLSAADLALVDEVRAAYQAACLVSCTG